MYEEAKENHEILDNNNEDPDQSLGLPLTFEIVKRKCICSVCLEAFDDEDMGVMCANSHFLCQEDLNPYLSENCFPQLYKLKFNKCSISCPAIGCEAVYMPVELFKRMGKHESSRYKSIINSVTESLETVRSGKVKLLEAMNLRCPSCLNPVDPHPDACSAIMCLNCGHYYCNYCFESFTSENGDNNRAAAHEHAAVHNEDPENKSPFLPHKLILEGQKDHRIKKINEVLDSMLDDEEISEHEVGLCLISLSQDFHDLDIDITELWENRNANESHTSESADTTEEAESVSSSQAGQVREGGYQLSNALRSGNSEAALQIINSFGNNLDVNYVDLATLHPITAVAIMAKQFDIAILLLQKGANYLQRTFNGRNIFYVAIECGSLSVLKYILDNNPNLDINAPITTEACQYTPLHVAARFNQGHIIRELHKRQATIDLAEEEFGYSALILSVVLGNEWSTKELLLLGASPLFQSRSGRTAAFVACEKGSLTVLDLILDTSTVDIDGIVGFPTGMRMVHVASLHKQPLALSRLIQRGADIDAVDLEHGYTPLIMAIISCSTMAALDLIRAGADTTKASTLGRQPMYVAIEKGLTEVVCALVQEGNVSLAKRTTSELIDGLPLHVAVLYKQPHLIDILLDLGADLNAVDENSSNTALMLAVIVQEEITVRQLLLRGADPTIKSKMGRTPIYVAAERGNTTIIDLLVRSYGVDPNACCTAERNGGTPMHIAAIFNKPNAIYHLLKLGADPSIRDKSGRSPLDVATISGSTSAVEILSNALDILGTFVQ